MTERGAGGAPSAVIDQPERWVNHYEIGIKSQFSDRRTTFNLSIFRTDINDYLAQMTNGQLGVHYFKQLAVNSGNTSLIAGRPCYPLTWGGTVKVKF